MSQVAIRGPFLEDNEAWALGFFVCPPVHEFQVVSELLYAVINFTPVTDRG